MAPPARRNGSTPSSQARARGAVVPIHIEVAEQMSEEQIIAYVLGVLCRQGWIDDWMMHRQAVTWLEGLKGGKR